MYKLIKERGLRELQSKGEIRIATLLREAEVPFVQEFAFPDLKSPNGVHLRFDFAVFQNPEDFEKGMRPLALIEVQGKQHYEQTFLTAEQFQRQLRYDKKKRNYCGAKGLRLFEISYQYIFTISIEEILEAINYF